MTRHVEDRHGGMDMCRTRLYAGGHVEDAAQLLRGLATLPAERFALAEATNSVLCTSDEKLSKGHRARVVLFTH
jgi:predicted nucleic acid-binding protein